jgi:hypothetical protein
VGDVSARGTSAAAKAKPVLELLLVARSHSVTKENYVSVLRRHLDGVGRGRDLVVPTPAATG